MSIKTKYKFPFQSLLGIDYEFRLKTEGYSGPQYKLFGTANPVEIENPQKGSNKFTPIKGQLLTANLWVEKDTTDYNFVSDFKEVNSREWVAELAKKTTDAKTGICKIDVLDLLASSKDATGSIEIIKTGYSGIIQYGKYLPRANVNFYGSYYAGQNPDVIKITFHACPPGCDPSSSDAILLISGQYQPSDYEIVTANDLSEAFHLQGNDNAYLEDKSGDYNGKIALNIKSYFEIDAAWSLQITCNVEDSYGEDAFYQKDVNTFNKEPHLDYIQVTWVERSSADQPYTDEIGCRYYKDGETLYSVALDMKNMIDGVSFNQVYFPATDEYKDVTLKANIDDTNSAKINIELDNIGTIGNNVEILRSISNDTNLIVSLPDSETSNTEYEVNLNDFSGGEDVGDNFTVTTKDNGGLETQLAQVKGFEGDTKNEIIQKLINFINGNYEKYEAQETANSDEFKLISYKTDDDQLKFTNDGNSTLTPSTYTDYSDGEGELKMFIGYVSPGYYSFNDFTKDYYQISLTAFDGLGDLKNFIFEIDNRRPFEKRSVISIISWALQQTSLNLKIYESFNLWEKNMDDSISPLLQTYISTEKYNGKSAYKVIEEICQAFWMYIRQINGHWELLQIDRQTETSYNRRVFDQYGNKIDEIVRDDHIIEAGGSSKPVIYLNKSAKYSYRDPYKKVELHQKYGYVPQLMRFPTFIGFSNVSASLYPWFITDNNLDPIINNEGFSKKDNFLRIYSGNKRLNQRIEIADYTEEDKYTYEVELLFDQKTSDEQSDSFDIELRIKESEVDGSYFTYKDNNDGTLSEVYDNIVTINIPVDTGENEQTKKFLFNYPQGYPDNLGTNVLLDIQVLQPDVGYINLKHVKINFKRQINSGIKKTSYYNELIDKTASEGYFDELKLGDVPNIPLAKYLYKNALYYYDSADEKYRLTSQWVDNIATPSISTTLSDYLRKLILEEYHRAISLLSVTMYGDIDLTDIIKETTTDNNLMMAIGGKWDVKRNSIEAEYQEIGLSNDTDTLITEINMEEGESSGTNIYTGETDSEGDVEVDLSDYWKETEIKSYIKGDTGTFSETDLTNREMTISHTRNTKTPFVLLVENGKPLSYNDEYIISAVISSTKVKIKILKPNLQTTNYRVL